MLESNTFFTKMIDELVEFSEYDPELSDGIKFYKNRDHNTIENHLAISRKIRKDFFTPVTSSSVRKFLGFTHAK